MYNDAKPLHIMAMILLLLNYPVCVHLDVFLHTFSPYQNQGLGTETS